MNTSRLRAAGAIAAGALLLSVIAPTAAHAHWEDDPPIPGDPGECDTKVDGMMVRCESQRFVEDTSKKTAPYDGPAVRVGDNAASCPGQGTITVGVTESVTTGSSFSYGLTVGGGAIFGTPFLQGMVTASVSVTWTSNSSATKGTNASMTIPEGRIGYMKFAPLMRTAVGEAIWARMQFKRGQVYSWRTVPTTAVVPFTNADGTTAGTFFPFSRPMDADELKLKCGYVAPEPNPFPDPGARKVPGDPGWSPRDPGSGPGTVN